MHHCEGQVVPFALVFPPSDLQVRPVDASALLELRRQVLRDGDQSARVSDRRDDVEGTLHLGGYLGPQLVCAVTLYREPPPFTSTRRSVQLRWMAVHGAFQRQGVGGAALAHAERLLASDGVEMIWANARDTALGFYRSQGWTVIEGSGYVAPPPLLLAHTTIYKELPGLPAADEDQPSAPPASTPAI